LLADSLYIEAIGAVKYLMEKASQGIARGTNRTHYRPQRNVRFMDLGKTI
jgi:hypothetical protein